MALDRFEREFGPRGAGLSAAPPGEGKGCVGRLRTGPYATPIDVSVALFAPDAMLTDADALPPTRVGPVG